MPAAHEELVFLPLGGAGEIGMNLNLYGYAGKWLMVDLGITFGDDSTPGVDVVMPDPAFIVERREALVGLVLTHAHEDHLGAVPDLWPQLRCPVYATPFAASVLRRKLSEAGIADAVPVTEVALGSRFSLGPFDLELVTMTHSILEPNALAIRTPAGTVLHTGDWKIDPAPLIGEVTDEAALRRIGDEGVLAMVCDSTNVFVKGESGSEADVRQALERLIAGRTGRVAVTCFASNLARVDSIAKAAVAVGRRPALVGRALYRMVDAARENGYLLDFPTTVAERDVGWLPRNEVCLICTGSQGEPRAALARLAQDDHPDIDLEPGDTVIFSSRVIPGNERSIGRIQNLLSERGIEIVSDSAEIHVSGHPARDELARLYQWVRPRVAIPVHGEHRHLVEHAALARACQVPEAFVAPNGSVVRLAPGPVEVIDHVPTGRLVRDGNRLLSIEDSALRDRRRVIWNGAVVATLVVDRAGRLLAPPALSMQGIGSDAASHVASAEAIEAVARAVEGLEPSRRDSDDALQEAARRAVRHAFRVRIGKKPLTDVQVVRI
jgi:ribonuclease J